MKSRGTESWAALRAHMAQLVAERLSDNERGPISRKLARRDVFARERLRRTDPSKINVANREFWQDENERLRKQTESEVGRLEVELAARRAEGQIRAGRISDPAFAGETSVHAGALKFEEERQQRDRQRRSNEQAEHGKKRKGFRDPRRAAVIASMRSARKNRSTLDEYLDAASAGSVDGVEITQESNDDYTIICDGAPENGSPVRYGALREWWKEAGKQNKKN